MGRSGRVPSEKVADPPQEALGATPAADRFRPGAPSRAALALPSGPLACARGSVANLLLFVSPSLFFLNETAGWMVTTEGL
jgi:hypothetical protein